MKKKLVALGDEFVCVLLVSLNFGMAMGWSFMRIRSTFGTDGAIVGGVVSSILGPILYYFLVRNYLTVNNLGMLVSCCSLSGILIALVSPWFSMVCVPGVLIAGCLLIRIRGSEKKNKITEEQGGKVQNSF